MDDHEELEHQRIALQQQVHALEPGETTGSNKKYKQLISKYKRYVDEEGGDSRFGLEQGRYINDLAIKSFYLMKESKRRANRKTARSTLLALNQLCLEEGHCPLDETSGAWETIQTVLDSLDKNSEKRAKNETINKDIAETNPTKIISVEEISKILFQELNQGNGKWQETSLVWVILSATLVRWFSGSLLSLEHLYVYKDLPPGGTRVPHDLSPWESNDDTGWVMSFLIPPSLQIKKNNKVSQRRTELVGAYRHKRAERCCAGILAFSLLERTNSKNVKISFLKNPPQGHISWREVKLFEKSYNATYDNMKDSMLKAEVPPWLKVTHLRKFGIAFLTAQGLTEDEVTTMTKHRDNNFTRSYRAEMCVQIASTLAGFLPKEDDDKYFVPRAHIPLPNGLDSDKEKFQELVHHLFPHVTIWTEELESVDGDKDHYESARHFLSVVIPWLTKVLIQDGVIWIKMFPSNSAKNILVHKMTVDPKGIELMGGLNYSQWAATARIEIQKMVDARKVAVASRDLTNQRIVQVLLQQHELQMATLKQTINQQLAGFFHQLRHGLSQQSSQVVGNYQSHTLEVQEHEGDSADLHCHEYAAQTENNNNDSPGRQEGGSRTIHEALNNGNDPIIPTIWQTNKYRTLENLVTMKIYHHHDFVTTSLLRKGGPLHAQKDHWVKLKRLYSRINDHKADRCYENITEAAKDLDVNERGLLSLNQYSDYLRNSNVFGGKYSGKRKR